jgi:transposase
MVGKLSHRPSRSRRTATEALVSLGLMRTAAAGLRRPRRGFKHSAFARGGAAAVAKAHGQALAPNLRKTTIEMQAKATKLLCTSAAWHNDESLLKPLIDFVPLSATV